jgi:ribonuclease HII
LSPGFRCVVLRACARSRHDSGKSAKNRQESRQGTSQPLKGVIAVAPPSFRRERALIKRGVWPVAGCDEAGRGPLAGPVVAPPSCWTRSEFPRGSTIPSG